MLAHSQMQTILANTRNNSLVYHLCRIPQKCHHTIWFVGIPLWAFNNICSHFFVCNPILMAMQIKFTSLDLSHSICSDGKPTPNDIFQQKWGLINKFTPLSFVCSEVWNLTACLCVILIWILRKLWIFCLSDRSHKDYYASAGRCSVTPS